MEDKLQELENRIKVLELLKDYDNGIIEGWYAGDELNELQKEKFYYVKGGELKFLTGDEWELRKTIYAQMRMLDNQVDDTKSKIIWDLNIKRVNELVEILEAQLV